LIFAKRADILRFLNRIAWTYEATTSAAHARFLRQFRPRSGGSKIPQKGRLTPSRTATRYAALRRHRALNGGAGKPVSVFDIVDLERETQAAALWRWFFGTVSTLTNAVS
jgi:hypothetical protein